VYQADPAIENIRFIGRGLVRPECALAHSSGLVFTPDWTGDGGISALFPDGSTKRHLAINWTEIAAECGIDGPLRPNGICLLADGSFLLAHLGDKQGGVFRLSPDGTVSPFLIAVDHRPLPPTNFVTVDRAGRTWVTVSTRKIPRAAAYRSGVADGFVILVDQRGARIVASGLGYTNECQVHPGTGHLYVNETFARRLTSFAIDEHGNLSNRTTIAEFGPGSFPDGLAFDENDDVWITSIVSNRVMKVDAKGNITTFLEDVDPAHLTWVEKAWQNHQMDRPHLDRAAGKYLKNISNLAFCGKNLDQAVLGCLLGDQLALYNMPVRGSRPIHWTYDITALIKTLTQRPQV